MYTWGYIKDATLAKMDFTANQAIDMGLVDKMPYYANEALTQITSAIKPNRKYTDFLVLDKDVVIKKIAEKLKNQDLSFLVNRPCDKTLLTEDQLEALEFYNTHLYVNDPINMPNDFVAWSDEIAYMKIKTVEIEGRGHMTRFGKVQAGYCELNDSYYSTYGSNKIVFYIPGEFRIPYKASWYKFTTTTNDDAGLDIPDDIVECIPSYIASQLFKIDDEQKSAIYRNEYEMALARIDENEYFTNKSFSDRGGW